MNSYQNSLPQALISPQTSITRPKQMYFIDQIYARSYFIFISFLITSSHKDHCYLQHFIITLHIRAKLLSISFPIFPAPKIHPQAKRIIQTLRSLLQLKMLAKITLIPHVQIHLTIKKKNNFQRRHSGAH